MRKARIQANIKNYQRRWPIDPHTIRRFIDKVWDALNRIPRMPAPAFLSASGTPVFSLFRCSSMPVELSVIVLNNRQIQSYNNQYRRKDAPTDVLSFPVNEIVDDSLYLGDILISSEMTANQALEKGHSFSKELKILLLHGFVHLLGYDHETDQGEMERLESRLRKTLDLYRL